MSFEGKLWDAVRELETGVAVGLTDALDTGWNIYLDAVRRLVIEALKRGDDPQEVGYVFGATIEAVSRLRSQKITDEEIEAEAIVAVFGKVSTKSRGAYRRGLDDGFDNPRKDFRKHYDDARAKNGLPRLDQDAVSYAEQLSTYCMHLNEELSGQWSMIEGQRFPALMSLMNEHHAVVAVGSSVRYWMRGRGIDGQLESRFLKRHDMATLYAGSLLPNPSRGLSKARATEAGKAATAGGAKLASAFELWDQWPGRRRLDGVGFFPGSCVNPPFVPAGYLNTWAGLSIRPRKARDGESGWGNIQRHLIEKVCGGNEKHATYLFDWFAQLIQEPQRKTGVAIVLRGKEGAGKSLVLDLFRRILGQSVFVASQPSQVTGQFNGHLEGALVLGVEEGFWAGDKAGEGKLKNLVTASRLSIERKGVDAYDAPNFTRLVIVSNEGWVIPAGSDSRRWFVLDVGDPPASTEERQAYFAPIFEEINGRGAQAFLDDMLGREITSDLFKAPATQALLEQRAASLDPMHYWLRKIACDGQTEALDPDTREPKLYDLRSGDEVPCSVVIEQIKAECKPYERRAVETRAGRVLSELGVVRKQTKSGREIRRYVYQFPFDFDAFKAAVLKRIGLDGYIAGDDVRDEFKVTSSNVVKLKRSGGARP